MKLQTYQAFKNHLQQNFGMHQNHLICVVGYDFYEREIIIKEVLAKFINARAVFLDCTEVNIASLQTELESNDLFAEKKVIVLKSIEKASKSFLKELATYLAKTSETTLLIEGEKLDQDLYDPLKGKLTALDLTKEKPWDRKSRIISWLHFYVRRDKKDLAQELAEYLYEMYPKQLSLMIQELSKLICFCKNSNRITLLDYQMISSDQRDEKLWGMSEAIVFQTDRALYQEAVSKNFEATTFHKLIAQLRYHLQIAAKIQALKEEKDLPSKSDLFPNLVAKTFQKYEKALMAFPKNYSEKALLVLYETERKSKTISIPEKILWIELMTKMHKIRKEAA